MNKLYAFWKYDIFPEICGGEVIKVDEEGNVETKEYGTNCWFKPGKLISLTEGKKIRLKLDNLKTRYRKEHGLLKTKFLQERNSIIKL